jgi:hypothetical protein
MHDSKREALERAPRRRLWAIWISAAVGALLLLTAVSTDVGAMWRDKPQAAPIVFAEREIPDEWQWKPNPVSVDSMYRKVDRPSLDWIRDNPQRWR